MSSSLLQGSYPGFQHRFIQPSASLDLQSDIMKTGSKQEVPSELPHPLKLLQAQKKNREEERRFMATLTADADPPEPNENFRWMNRNQLEPISAVEPLVELEPINRTNLGELLQQNKGSVKAENMMMLSPLSSRDV